MMTDKRLPFFTRLKTNRNAFAMVLFEPMWGIPFYLFFPYMSLYMASLGCTPAQIGLVSTVGMVFQMFFALLASPLTDRMGRRRTTLVFDIVSWSVAVALWFFARNFWFFIAAAVFQAINRVVHVSWTCLLVEDTEKDLLVTIFSWVTIAGLLSAVFAPVAAIFVDAYTVVPAVRGMLAIAFVSMTAMFFLRNAATRETSVGYRRMAETRALSFGSQIAGFIRVAGDVGRNRRTLFFFILTALYNVALTVKAPFFALLLTGPLGFTDAWAGYFAAATSLTMLVIYLFAQPLLRRLQPRLPLSAGLLLCAAGSLVLLVNAASWWVNLAVVIASVVLTAAGTAVAQPLIDGISHGSMDNEKRSRMTSLLLALTLFSSAPFGVIGGWLFTVNERIPFAAASALFVVCAALLWVFYRKPEEQGQSA